MRPGGFGSGAVSGFHEVIWLEEPIEVTESCSSEECKKQRRALEEVHEKLLYIRNVARFHRGPVAGTIIRLAQESLAQIERVGVKRS